MHALFVDIGISNIGWALGRPDDVPISGCYHPPKTGSNLAWLVIDVETFFGPLMDTHKVTHCAYESPVKYDDNSLMTLRKLHSVGTKIEEVAYRRKIPCEEALPGVIRKHFLGCGNTPKARADIKDAVIRRCNMLGWYPETDHAADSLAGWHYLISMKTSRLAKTMELL